MVFDRSNGINRGFVATLVVLAIVAASLFFLIRDLSMVDSAYSHAATDASVEYERNTQAYIKETCFTPSGLKEPDCAAKAYEAEREGQRKEQDLAAQNITAWWTKVMGIAAMIGMALSAVGVWLVKKTFDATRRSNEIASDTTEAENRAWIKVTPRLSRVHVWNEAIQIQNLEIKIENVGDSVARQVRCWASLHIKPSGDAFRINFDDLPEPQFFVSDLLLNIWPHEPKEIIRAAHGIGPETSGYVGRDFEIYLKVVAEYKTVFHPHRDRITELIVRLIDLRGGPFNQGHIPQDGAMLYNINERPDGSGGGRIT